MLALPQSTVTMYIDHFRLNGTPFSIAPDPRFLYMSAQHREALAHLLYGVNAGGGIVLLTGEVGAGKTTVCRSLLQQVDPSCKIAYIFNPRLSADELLQAVCQEFGVQPAGAQSSYRDGVEALNRYLLASYAQGQNNLLIIDEAQNLSPEVLEQLRLLTNLETNERKLLQIILIGQPELRTQLQQPALEQLSQRIIARYHLGPLSAQDCRGYIIHRLAVAGARSAPLFSEAAMRLVHKLSAGVPRKINLLCDRALLAAYAGSHASVDEKLVRRAAAEVFAAPASRPRHLVPAAAVVALAGLTVALWPWASALLNKSAQPAVVAGSAKPAVVAPRPVLVAHAASQSAAALPNPPTDTVRHAPTSSSDKSVLPLLEPQLLQASADEDDQLRHLARHWGLSLDAKSPPCADGADTGVHCHRGKAGLAELRAMGQPLLLRVKGRDSQVRVLRVRSMDASEAVVEQESGPVRVRLSGLEAISTGEYLTLLRTPPGFRAQLATGMRGADVDWVSRRLAAWAGLTEPAEGRSMDAALVQQVRQFQQLQGLEADGVVGPKTWMKLQTLSGSERGQDSAALALARQ